MIIVIERVQLLLQHMVCIMAHFIDENVSNSVDRSNNHLSSLPISNYMYCQLGCRHYSKCKFSKICFISSRLKNLPIELLSMVILVLTMTQVGISVLEKKVV